jgi:hypothetical protein
MAGNDLAARVAALEQAVADLVAARRPAPAEPPPEGDYWALEGLRGRIDEDGGVLFVASVRLPTSERYEWQWARPAGYLFGDEAVDWADLAPALGALAHPVRLRLLRRVLEGARGAAELADDPELGTTGQLYHHLRQLAAAGWLRSTGRGRYAVPGERVVPLLTILVAAQP